MTYGPETASSCLEEKVVEMRCDLRIRYLGEVQDRIRRGLFQHSRRKRRAQITHHLGRRDHHEAIEGLLRQLRIEPVGKLVREVALLLAAGIDVGADGVPRRADGFNVRGRRSRATSLVFGSSLEKVAPSTV